MNEQVACNQPGEWGVAWQVLPAHDRTCVKAQRSQRAGCPQGTSDGYGAKSTNCRGARDEAGTCQVLVDLAQLKNLYFGPG